MKRRSARKCDSFDYIKLSPKKSILNNNSISLRQPDYGMSAYSQISRVGDMQPSFHYSNSNNRDKEKDSKYHYLELPKIHAMNFQKIKKLQKEKERLLSKQKQKEKQKQKSQLDTQYTHLQNRLLLLGNQYQPRRQTQNLSSIQRSNQNYPSSLQISVSRKKVQNSQPQNSHISALSHISHNIYSHPYRPQSPYSPSSLSFSVSHSNSYGHPFSYSGLTPFQQLLLSFGIAEFVLEKKKVNVYVEEGNNSRMVKEMLRKRGNVVIGEKKDANFVWTRFCDYQCSKMGSKISQEKLEKIQMNQLEQDRESRNCKQKQVVPKYLKQTIQNQITSYIKLTIHDLKIHNHLTSHFELSDKKSLFTNLSKYCQKNSIPLSSLIPQTYPIPIPSSPSQLSSSSSLPAQITETGHYFIKPGEDTNRGQGISIAMGRDKIWEAVENLAKIGRSALVQEYIEPLLYRGRKFDIRTYAIVVCMRGELRGFWYREGYVRTCSKQFSYNLSDVYAHLTNDAIQKTSPLYSKYEQSNKLSFQSLSTYFSTLSSNQFSTLSPSSSSSNPLSSTSSPPSFPPTMTSMLSQIKNLITHSLLAVSPLLLASQQKNQLNFEIFGYDFLIDRNGKVWLIEVNTNPCLQFTGSLTARVIGNMIWDSFGLIGGLIGDMGERNKGERRDESKYERVV